MPHVIGLPCGSVNVQLTAPLGSTALVTPETVVVSVVVPLRVGFAEATRVIVGFCWVTVNVSAELEIDA